MKSDLPPELEARRKQEEISRLARFEEHNQRPTSREPPKAPLILRVEVVNLCNADCVFCSYQYQRRQIETMSFDIFKLAVDQYLALNGAYINFTPVVGDSLIDRNLEEKVAYVRQFPQFVRIEMWTNGILLTRERFEALVEAGVNEFYISTSGFSAAEYKQIYRNGNYIKVLNNLTEIAQSPALKKVRFVVMARTSSAEPKKSADYIKLRALDAFPIVFQTEMFSWHGQIRQEDLPGRMFLINKPWDQSRPCFQLWTGFTLLSNGDMTLCGCTDIDCAGLPLGNIREVALDEHLRNGSWLKLRDSFVAGTPPEFCRGCDMYWPSELMPLLSNSP
jgi:MoaA/NifB/PqqE/SkfB family radical SAM enzyme